MLDSLSPLDGRYRDKTAELRKFCSEQTLIEARLRIECLWLLHLDTHVWQGKLLPSSARETLTDFSHTPPTQAAEEIKKLEQTTNHDVKAVEYFLRNRFANHDFTSCIHFGLTSEDINNLAYALMTKNALHRCLLPRMREITSALKRMAIIWAAEPMLARTHGQAASPTTMGKEMAVFCLRLYQQMIAIQKQPLRGKLNGATGNYHALTIAVPDQDWETICRLFVEEKIGVAYNPLTTQIADHDALITLCDQINHFNMILKGLAQDLWFYVSCAYFKLKTKKNEVGSSTMPQKVNPIDFENAEGNLGVADALGRHFSSKLAVSRLQRDLSDSTVLRVVGSMWGHSLIAYTSMLNGFAKLELQRENLRRDLEDDWSVLTEAVQTVLRRNHVANAYEILKDFARGQKIGATDYHQFISSLSTLTEEDKKMLAQLTPATYTGRAEKLARSLDVAVPDL